MTARLTARPTASRSASDDALVDRLEAHGLVAAGQVDQIRSLHQRSLCFRVDTTDGRTLFAKRPRRTASGDWSADVVAEGRRLGKVNQLTGELAPTVLALSAEDRLLVTTYFAGHRHLDEIGLSDASATEVASALGSALAAVHAVPFAPAGGDPNALPTVDLVDDIVAQLLYPTPAGATAHPDGYVETLVGVRAAGLAQPLRSYAAAVRDVPMAERRLIHGDLKSNNVLVSTDPLDVRLIDWETAGWGDPRWDVGAVIGDRVFTWLRGIRFQGAGGLSAWLEAADTPIETVQGQLRAFLLGYGVTDGELGDADRHLVLAAAATFLLQRTLAAALGAPALPALALAALQVAGQLLTRPDQIAEVLL
jgi:aminoglycoside phosphotransferase (APT) family kinase protein